MPKSQSAEDSRPSIPPAAKYVGMGCGGVLVLLLVCSGVLRIIATTVDPEGFANVQAGKNRDGSEPEPERATPGSPQEQLAAVEWGDLVSAVSLYNRFNGNEVAADAEFKGKTIFIDGEVVNVENSGFSGVTINLAHRSGLVGVRCVLSRSGARSEDLAHVGLGSWLKVRGKCEGKLPSGAVRLTGCDFILVNR